MKLPKKCLTTIFIVDDDLQFLEKLKAFLSIHFPKTNIVTFTTGELCLDRLNQRPDIIILDFHLNKKFAEAKEGFEILKKIKEAKPKVPTIILSKHSNISNAVESLHFGATDFITKSELDFIKIKHRINYTFLNKQNMFLNSIFRKMKNNFRLAI